MSNPLPTPARLGQLAAIAVWVLCVMGFIGTIVYPPWAKVSGDHFWNHILSTQKLEFAGFDFLNSPDKWEKTFYGPQWSGYQIDWGILFLEWVLLLAVAGIVVLMGRGWPTDNGPRPNL